MKSVIPVLQKNLAVSGGATIGPNGYKPDLWKNVLYGSMTLAGGTRLDLYPFKEKIFTCTHPYHYKQGENQTQIFMEGRWIRVPKNPGRYIRAASGTYLKHVTWTLGMGISDFVKHL